MVFLDEKQKELSEYKTNMVNIKQYASDLQTFLALKQIGSDVEAKDTCLHALVNSDSLKQTKISCNIDTSLKNLTTSIQSLGEVVVESKPCELTLVRKKDKQAQIMVADLLPMSVDNIHLNLKQKVNTKEIISGDVLYCQMVEWYFPATENVLQQMIQPHYCLL
jgi:hypothetical protein